MIIINLGNNLEAQVELAITLNNITLWDYLYKWDLTIRNSQKINLPKRASLGMVGNLMGDRNNWSFDLLNEQNEDKGVDLKLEWYVDDNLVASWIPDEAQDGKVTIAANSSDGFSDSCKFLK